MYDSKRLLSLALVGAIVLVGCSTNDIQSRGKLDYLTASSANPLELPPDLTKQTTGDRRAIETLSQYRQITATQGQGSNVLAHSQDVRIERAGEQRWISAKLPADYVWTRAMQLFQELGLQIESSNPEAGLAETAWAENRADVPDSFIRRFLKGAMGNMFSAPTRDKFKLRLERQDSETVLVYVTHYGMRDKASGNDDQFHTWVERPRDTELEAEFLSQLLVKLGGSQSAEALEHGVVETEQEGNRLTVNRPFNSIWIQVGTVLDDGSEYRISEQNSVANSYRVLRSKKAKRGLKFWRSKRDHDAFIVTVNDLGSNRTEIVVEPEGDRTYLQALIDRMKNNLH